MRTQRWTEIHLCAERLQQAAEAQHGPNSIEVANAILVMLEARCNLGTCGGPDAISAARRALAIGETVYDQGTEEARRLVIRLRSALEGSGLLSESRALLERELSNAEGRYGTAEMRIIPSLRLLADHEWAWGSLERARGLAERVLRIQERALGIDDPETAETNYWLARLAYFDADFPGALGFLNRAMSFYEVRGSIEDQRYAGCLNLQGLIHLGEGEYKESFRYLEAGLALRRKVLMPWHSEIGASHLNLAELSRYIGDMTAARKHLEQTLAVYIKDRGSEDPEVAMARGSLGEVFLAFGDLHAAREQFSEANRVLDCTTAGSARPYCPSVLAGVAKVYLNSGAHESARGVLTQALGLAQRRYGPEHPEVADLLILISEVDEARGDLHSSLGEAERALAIREKLLGEKHPAVADALEAVAHIHATAGRFQDALRAALRAAAISRGHLELTATALPERQALKYAASTRTKLETLVSIAAGSPAMVDWLTIFDAVIRSRALVLDEMALRHQRIFEATDLESARLAHELERVKSLAASLAFRGPDLRGTVSFRTRWEAALARKEDIERALVQTSAASSSHVWPAAVGMAQVGAALPEDAVLVSYVRHGVPEASRYAAFTLQAGSAARPQFVDLGSAARIDAVIDSWRLQASRRPPASVRMAMVAEDQYIRAAQQLRRVLWDPLAPGLGDAARLFVVPEGNIHLVNFGALRLEDGRYLVETGPLIHYLSTERDLMRPVLRSNVSGEVLAFGAPDYDAAPSSVEGKPASDASSRRTSALYRGATSSCQDFQRVRFEALPMSEVEAREVVWLYRERIKDVGTDKYRVMTGGDADETQFKQYAGHYRVLHVATHGFFLDMACDGSHPTGALDENPLLRSGLVFAGANRRRAMSVESDLDDGILTAEEIASLDLSAVEWAVLSACGTGLGQTQSGEGLLGLRRAFLTAGARTVITSLWQVTDEGSRNWMMELHRGRLEGLPSSEAVRSASLRMLSAQRAAGKGSHPFYWGAFLAAGD